jgi:hypothetical protein
LLVVDFNDILAKHIHLPLFNVPMAKKKTKTVASTKKAPNKVNVQQSKEPKKKKLSRLFKKKKNEVKEKKSGKEEKKEAAPKAAQKKVIAKVEAQIPLKPGKKRKQRTPMSAAKKQKIRGGFLIFIGLFALIFIGYFLFGKIFKPQDLAEISPAKLTVAVFELNIDGRHSQTAQFYQLMEKYQVYSKDNLVKLVENVLPYDYEKDMGPWLGRKVGFTLYDTNTVPGASSLTPIFFVENIDRNATVEFLKKRTLADGDGEFTESEYDGYPVYSYKIGQKAQFTFVNSYLVFTENERLLQKYLDDLSEGDRLSDDTDYRKVANNLPQGGLVFGYVNLHKLIDAYEKDETFIAQKGQELLALRPFLNVFTAEGLTVFAENNRLTAQTFTAIDNETLDGESYLTFSEKYQGELLALANDNPVFIAGGHDLTKEINRLEDVFKSGTKTPALVFEGILEAQKQTYFGKDIGLKEDLLPLLTGEYLLTVEGSIEDPDVTFFLELDEKNTDIPRFEKVINAFVEVSGLFTPKVQTVTLEDGTIGQEIVASPEEVEKTTSSYHGNNITVLKLGETGIVMNYVILDDIVALSTNQNALKDVIDRAQGTLQEGLTTGQFYSSNIQPILRTADEMLHVKLGALTGFLGLDAEPNVGPYLVPFSNLTVTKNYFRDGISTIYFIEVI